METLFYNDFQKPEGTDKHYIWSAKSAIVPWSTTYMKCYKSKQTWFPLAEAFAWKATKLQLRHVVACSTGRGTIGVWLALPLCSAHTEGGREPVSDSTAAQVLWDCYVLPDFSQEQDDQHAPWLSMFTFFSPLLE